MPSGKETLILNRSATPLPVIRRHQEYFGVITCRVETKGRLRQYADIRGYIILHIPYAGVLHNDRKTGYEEEQCGSKFPIQRGMSR